MVEEPAILAETDRSPSPPAAIDEASLPQPLAILRLGSPANECTFYILGTAHVSRQSCDDTAALIQKVKPELVIVELCQERQPILQLEKVKVCI